MASSKYPKSDSPTAKAYLLNRGWWIADDGWRHPNLAKPWPIADAFQLQREADDGRQELVHRLVRGQER